jgi:hypothetical protein
LSGQMHSASNKYTTLEVMIKLPEPPLLGNTIVRNNMIKLDLIIIARKQQLILHVVVLSGSNAKTNRTAAVPGKGL